MKTRIIHTKIHFEDDWFNTLSIQYRYLFIYFFTNTHIGLTGAYKLSKRVGLLETGATEDEWNQACQKFQEDNKIKFIDDWVIVLNAWKYANYSGVKNEVAYKKELLNVPELIRNSVSIHYIYPIDTSINHKSETINKKLEIVNHKLKEKFVFKDNVAIKVEENDTPF